MKRKKRIEKILSNTFKTWIIKVIDISYQHKGHNQFSGNEESHFSIILYPKVNKNFNRIDIHRKINFLLKNELLSGLHAIEIKIKN
tara:strand:- start:315 stop:572 length:258 start_codon:yes stop_codon:yes gene_type:complete